MNVSVQEIADTILVATDSSADAKLVQDMLQREFAHVVASTDPARLKADFTRHRPSVLVLAFDTLEKSQLHYLDLYRLCESVHEYPHRAVLLCSKDELKQAYDLCIKDHFDDYVLFWPMNHDSSRLAMVVHSALRKLASLRYEGPSAAEFATQARRLAQLEKTLDEQVAEGKRHIETAHHAVEQAERNIDLALDALARQLASGAPSGGGTARSAENLHEEFARFKREDLRPHLDAATESVRPLRQWAENLRTEFDPLLESASALGALAERVQPIVLVVDDDKLQHKIIAKLLESEGYTLVFAGSGAEALDLVLNKVHPDAVLMDVMMPGLDGMETTRKLKGIPQAAHTPVIMITGKSEGKVVADSLRAGAADFVVKPFVRATLIAKIARVLDAAARR